MNQASYFDAEHTGKRKQPRRECFLAEKVQVVPWAGLLALIEPLYLKDGNGRPPYRLEAILRIHLLQSWFALSGRRHCMR